MKNPAMRVERMTAKSAELMTAKSAESMAAKCRVNDSKVQNQ